MAQVICWFIFSVHLYNWLIGNIDNEDRDFQQKGSLFTRNLIHTRKLVEMLQIQGGIG